ncbi:MAG: phosphoribosylaminoimidazolesuccinocarboxamide synthase [Halobacteria archaeon]
MPARPAPKGSRKGPPAKLAHTGSVKSLYVEKPPTADSFGTGYFEFSDHYSVFDYGRMPDDIPSKGEALKRMSLHWFKALEAAGVQTHFLGDGGARRLRIRVSRKLPLSRIRPGAKNYMVPLEVIFRNKIPPASSLAKRLRAGEARPADYGLSRAPGETETVVLAEPVVEFSTKLEEIDRYISREEAREIGRLTSRQVAEVEETARAVNRLLTREMASRGLDHVDGKIELLIGPEGELRVGDTVGTSDENRILYQGMDLSKQMARDYYRREGWHDNLQAARKMGLKDPRPPRMEREFLAILDGAYRALAVAITGERWPGAPGLDSVMEAYRDYLAQNKWIKKVAKIA